MLSRYSLLNHHTLPTGRIRQRTPVTLPGCCCRAAAVSVRCQARVKKARKAAPKTSGSGRSRGFGGKAQDSWEAELLPPYRAYYKQGYKPPRFQGPLQLTTFEDGSVGLVTEKEAVQAELLAVSHPVAFLEGDMGTAPPVEDLHVALLEAQLRPSIHKVFSLLPQRPLTKPRSRTTPPAAAGEEGDAVDSGSSTAAAAADVLSQQQQQQLYGGEVPGDILQLLPTYWDQQPELLAAVGGGDQLGSKVLMRMLQASCWSEEFRDPASSQVRHERPCGFIGVWPEFSLLRHSCAPNSSTCVVDRFMFIHATEDIPEGEEVTANKLGAVVTSPLSARQSAHQQLFGHPCGCKRCRAEGELPADAAAELQAVADKAQGEWSDRFQAALEGPSSGSLTDEQAAEALGELQDEISEALLSLEDSLAAVTSNSEDRLLLSAAVYPAYDLAWQMEELLMETPDLNKLASCVALQRMFARGSEGHVYSALLLQQAYAARMQEMERQAANAPRKTVAMQRRLTAQINKLLGEARVADLVYVEAVPCRYGMIPDQGLRPQLEEGLTLFYAGLSALSAAQGEGLEQVPEVTRDIVVDGIPVTVTDTVEGMAFGTPAAAAEGSSSGRPRFTLEVLDDAAAGEGEEVEEAAAAAVAALAAGSSESVAEQEESNQEQERKAEPVGS